MGIGAITNSYQVGYRGYESTGVAKADEKPTGLATIPYSDSLNETSPMHQSMNGK